MIEVITDNKMVSRHDIFARVSQCVAVGTIDERLMIGGIAHIHYRQNINEAYKGFLDSFFEEMINRSSKINGIYIAGGSADFVGGLGYINGHLTAGNVINYVRNCFPCYNIIEDIGGKGVIRLLEIFPSMGYGTIKPIKNA